jgi:hypothetical protein
MRRRELLGAVATGVIVGASGCLGGELVLEKQESVRIEAHRAWVQEIDEASGAGSLSYAVRSADDRFYVLYFTSGAEYEEYRDSTLGNGSKEAGSSGGASDGLPTGHDELTSIAVRNDERDAFEAEMPTDGGRYSLDFDGTHYLVVDYSSYGQGMQVPDTAGPIQATVSLEVVEDRF